LWFEHQTKLSIALRSAKKDLGTPIHPFAAFTLAHRARAAAAIFFRADALIVRFGFASGDPFAFADVPFAPPACSAWIRAHRALAAAPILARPAALIFRRPRPARFSGAIGPLAVCAPERIPANSSFRASIRSFRSAALRSCADDRLRRGLFVCIGEL
jgi:hypothetical protein